MTISQGDPILLCFCECIIYLIYLYICVKMAVVSSANLIILLIGHSHGDQEVQERAEYTALWDSSVCLREVVGKVKL